MALNAPSQCGCDHSSKGVLTNSQTLRKWRQPCLLAWTVTQCCPDHCLGEELGAWTTLRGQGVPGEDSLGWGSAGEKGTHLAPGTTPTPAPPAPPEGVGRG